jgi:hypothetical protein
MHAADRHARLGNASTGSAASGCRSNADCPYPTAVCDTVSRKCVGCLTVSDCEAMPGTVCSKGACTCPSTKAEPLTYCGGASPGCFDTQASADHCGACGKACDGGSCKSGSCEGAGAGGGGTGGDGGVEAGAPCVASCAEAVTKGGTVCLDAGAYPDYQKLGFCAGCQGAGGCEMECSTTFCKDKPVPASDAGTTCNGCLLLACPALYTSCMME